MRKQTKLVAVMSAAALLAIGASMTSFAATKGWVEENGVWMYLDSDGDPVSEEWKKSGNQFFWLDENGEMATDALIEDDDNKYYVDTNGARVINQWRQVDNEDSWSNGESGEEPESVWYYFGSNGKAATGKKTINGKTYIFDDGGEMFYSWHNYTNSSDKVIPYYLGNENEGWAYTGWHWLEIEEELQDDNKYDNDEAWFHFKSSGEMRKDNDAVYINGAYYGFDENGVMNSGWRPDPVEDGEATATANRFYSDDNGNVVKGWNFVYDYKDWDAQDGDEHWYYIETKGRPFNIGGEYKNDKAGTTSGVTATKYKDGGVVDKTYYNVAAKVIKKKTYLFDDTGMMLTGVISLDKSTPRVGGANLDAGTYYFNKNGGSTNGQRETGKVTITYDGDDYHYNFDKNSGIAYKNQIVDNCLYDLNGVRLNSDEGKAFLELDSEDFDLDEIFVKGKSSVKLDFSGTAGVIVSNSGKLVKDNKKIKVQDEYYTVVNFVARPYVEPAK